MEEGASDVSFSYKLAMKLPIIAADFSWKCETV